MAGNNGGRKKHLVEGEVAEITKSKTGLGTGKVGKGEGFLSSLIKSLSKNEKSKGTKNEKRKF